MIGMPSVRTLLSFRISFQRAKRRKPHCKKHRAPSFRDSGRHACFKVTLAVPTILGVLALVICLLSDSQMTSPEVTGLSGISFCGILKDLKRMGLKMF